MALGDAPLDRDQRIVERVGRDRVRDRLTDVDDRAQKQGQDLVGAVSDDDPGRVHAEEVSDLLAERSRRRIGVEPEALARAGDRLLDPG
jgi:hypothetical protein